MNEKELIILFYGVLIITLGGMVSYLKFIIEKNKPTEPFNVLVVMFSIASICVLLAWYIFSETMHTRTFTFLMLSTGMFNITLSTLKSFFKLHEGIND